MLNCTDHRSIIDLFILVVSPVDFEAKPKELTGRSRSVSKDFTEQMKLIYKSHYNTHVLDVLTRKFKIQL